MNKTLPIANSLCDLTCCAYCPFRHLDISICKLNLMFWINKQNTKDVSILYDKLKKEDLVNDRIDK